MYLLWLTLYITVIMDDCAALKDVNAPTIMISFLMPSGLLVKHLQWFSHGCRRARRTRHVVIQLFLTIISCSVKENYCKTCLTRKLRQVCRSIQVFSSRSQVIEPTPCPARPQSCCLVRTLPITRACSPGLFHLLTLWAFWNVKPSFMVI